MVEFEDELRKEQIEMCRRDSMWAERIHNHLFKFEQVLIEIMAGITMYDKNIQKASVAFNQTNIGKIVELHEHMCDLIESSKTLEVITKAQLKTDAVNRIIDLEATNEKLLISEAKLKQQCVSLEAERDMLQDQLDGISGYAKERGIIKDPEPEPTPEPEEETTEEIGHDNVDTR